MDNLELTKQVFARFGAADVDGIVELLHDDCVIDFYGPPEIPYAGHYQGTAQCRSFFDTVLASVDIHVFDQHEFICARDKVVVVGDLRLTTKASGAEIQSDYVHVITCRDGKWLHFQDFMNTAAASRAFGG